MLNEKKEKRKMEKKNVLFVIGIVAVIAAFIFGVVYIEPGAYLKNSTKESAAGTIITATTNADAAMQKKIDSLQHLIKLKNDQCKIDSLESVLNGPCKAQTSKAAIEASLQHKVDSLKKLVKLREYQMAKQKGKGKNIVVDKQKGLTSKSSFKPTVKTKVIKGDTAEEAAVQTNQTKKQFQTTSEYETDLQSGVQYVGGTDGDFYITVSFDGFLQYVFSKKMYDDAGGTGVPELNYKGSGKKFSYDEQEKVYYYTNTGIPIDEGTANGTYSWAVFIGQKDGYDAYLPHEVLKTAITTARGDLAGTISTEDVIKIGNIIPEVKAGRIQPNKITAIGDYDANKYEGWQFRTKVLYTKVQNAE